MQENIDLKPYTSLYVGGEARYFIVASSVAQIKDALTFARDKKLSHFVLGGGSNIVVSDLGFEGVVIKNAILGIEKSCEDAEYVRFNVGAGESWDAFVEFAVQHNLYGIENLSHIPGTVGASVVQNIGAYGAEVSTSVVSINVLDTLSFEEKVLDRDELQFSYRKSRLNDPLQDKGRYIVLSVCFDLQKTGKLNLKYDDIKKYFEINSHTEATLTTTRQAIIEIRNKKFPFPDKPEHGTVGSFWNATPVNTETYEHIILKLKALGFMDKAEEMIKKRTAFTVAQGYKIVPGLFIEILGLKGKVVGGAKILETHAGVINNFSGRATFKDILDLSDLVVSKLREEFNIEVRVEPELVGKF